MFGALATYENLILKKTWAQSLALEATLNPLNYGPSFQINTVPTSLQIPLTFLVKLFKLIAAQAIIFKYFKLMQLYKSTH